MRKTTITGLVTALLLITQAQAQLRTRADIRTVELPEYKTINHNLNTIQTPVKNSMLFNMFFQKLDTLVEAGKGRISILHIGASHVQAGVLSDRIRHNLDIFNGDFKTPRGLIFPYSVAKTNNPFSYKVTYSGEWSRVRNVQNNREKPLGMTGIAVYTDDSAAQINVSFNSSEARRWEFTQLRLLGYVEDGSNSVIPIIRRNNDTIVGRIDTASKTYLFDFPKPEDSFSMSFIQKDSIPHTFVVRGFILEKETPGIVYNAIGVNGASVSSYIDCEDFEKELHLLKPDMVVFEIGINDAASQHFKKELFYKNYSLLIGKIKRVSPDCTFIFITNNDSFKRISRRRYRVNQNGAIARKVFFQLAAENQGGVWDLFSLMGGLGSMQQWQALGLAKTDKVHFTNDGYQLVGDMFYNAFAKYYKTR
ncbi:MAG: GDSL-type esterase/lipase family protein [Fibromonadales bacterium]|nr:GDSL-type esterase/lipase family protein [Fibromonadales bacterium]